MSKDAWGSTKKGERIMLLVDRIKSTRQIAPDEVNFLIVKKRRSVAFSSQYGIRLAKGNYKYCTLRIQDGILIVGNRRPLIVRYYIGTKEEIIIFPWDEETLFVTMPPTCVFFEISVISMHSSTQKADALIRQLGAIR